MRNPPYSDDDSALQHGTNLLVSPAWVSFMGFCKRIGHGEIDKLKIADGVPVLAEKVTEKTKFG